MKNNQSNHPLYRLRFALGQMTETAFAKLLGIPRHQVANIEHGRSRSGLDLLLARRIQAATGVSAESLIRGDKPLLMVSGRKVDLAGFEAWKNKPIDQEDRISQKEEISLRCQLLLNVAASRGSGELRRMFHRLCGAIEEVRTESQVSMNDLDAQARACATIHDGTPTRAQLDKLLSESPEYQEIRDKLPARGPIKSMTESFRVWGLAGERLGVTLGHTPDSTETIRVIWRIQAKDGEWHEITQDRCTLKAVGKSDAVDGIIKQIKSGAKKVTIEIPMD